MSRLKGFAAAGLQILNQTKPAFVMSYVQPSSLFKAGLCILILLTFFVAAKVTSKDAGYDSSPSLGSGGIVFGGSPDLQSKLYQNIFALQDSGQMTKADGLIGQLKDHDLLGHIMAQRLLSPAYKASFNELKNWMHQYSDLPQAKRIARLANVRAPSGSGKVPDPTYLAQNIEAMDDQATSAKYYKSKIFRSNEQESMVNALIRLVRGHIQIYEPSAALRLLNESEASLYIDQVEKDRINALIASGYLYAGKVKEAQNLANQSLKSSGEYAPMAGWVNGLAAWQAKDYALAAQSFQSTAKSPYASGWLSSAASYWTARSYDKLGNHRRQKQWLESAAENPRTFYGLLAVAALDENDNLNWQSPNLTVLQEHEILGAPAGRRAEKLLAAGQVELAEDEIEGLYIRGNSSRRKALMAYAYDRKLPSLSMRLAYAVRGDTKNGDINSALYPDMPWAPDNGYKVDRALLHAIARQESRFNPAAENKGSGATGLMQLMPRTAYHVAKQDVYLDAEGRTLLKNPQTSLGLGQKYVEELLNNSVVGQDLLSLAMAYNAGPGNLAKWKSERVGMDDPLMFIETIPFAETRNYVERVMANYWMYRMRFDQPNDSMVALAQGKWARYAALDKDTTSVASAR